MTHDAKKTLTLAIFEIYESIQGESLFPAPFSAMGVAP